MRYLKNEHLTGRKGTKLIIGEDPFTVHTLLTMANMYKDKDAPPQPLAAVNKREDIQTSLEEQAKADIIELGDVEWTTLRKAAETVSIVLYDTHARYILKRLDELVEIGRDGIELARIGPDGVELSDGKDG